MVETIYLRVDRYGVRAMTKTMPQLKKGEYPVKLNIEVKPEAFREPLMEKSIIVEDWRQGMAFPDLDLKEMTITQAEAEKIVKEREAQLVKDMRARGYQITPPEETK